MTRPALLLALAASLLPGQAAATRTAKAQPGTTQQATASPAASAATLPRLLALSAGKSQLPAKSICWASVPAPPT